MKSREIILIIILLSSTITFGQNYQTVNPNRISFFDNNGGYINCIRIDSVKYQTDSTLFPFSNIRESSYGCYTPFGSSWIGQKIIIKVNGINVFFNKNHDSIQIKTNALLNESWTICNLPDSIAIIATVIKQDTMSFMGLLDSVKTIGFQVYDKNMSPLDYELNSMELKISKNFGFVSTLNFYFFPQYQNSYPFEQIEEYELIGLSNPKLGIQNLTWFEVNDFQPGDELHVLYESHSFGEQVTQKTIKRYLERTDFADSILYKIEYTQSIYRDQVTDYYYAFFQDTITSLVRNDTLFNLLPGEPVVTEYETYSTSMWNGINVTKTLPEMSNKYGYSNDTCWQPPIVDDCDPSYTYIKGLGGPYYECENGFSWGKIESNLVYYKKGEMIWGVPLIITGIQDNNVESKINVFPNPAKDFITIQMEEYGQSVVFEIFDLKGKIILKKLIDSMESKIGIADLNPGFYIYRLQGNGQIFKIDKLIIK